MEREKFLSKEEKNEVIELLSKIASISKAFSDDLAYEFSDAYIAQKFYEARFSQISDTYEKLHKILGKKGGAE